MRDLVETVSPAIEVTSRFVACNKIRVPEADRKRRAFSKEFASKLALAIAAEGLLEPIILRPDPETPGSYILVAGRVRLHAVYTVLKHDMIEAKVIDMDDVEAEMTADSSNLFRSPLTADQMTLATQRWYKHYAEKYPERVGSGNWQRDKSRASKSGKSGAQGAKAQVELLPSENTSAPENGQPTTVIAEVEPVKTFSEMVSDATGMSHASAKRHVKLAKRFATDQIETFEQMKVPLDEQEAIARIKSKSQRNEIVNLIASGMDPAPAIATVTKPDGGVVKLPGGRSKVVANGEVASESKIPDQEWLEKFCTPVRPLLANKTIYDRDAILYRRLVDALAALRHAAKKPLAEARKIPGYGSFMGRLVWVLEHVHPRGWLVCANCKGTGVLPGSQTECTECYGAAYIGRKDG